MMSVRFSYTLLKVGPTRAAEITGVSNTTQRDWRRMKHLPATEGVAQYDLIDLCELWVLKAAADAGYGPARTKSFSRPAAHQMAWHALQVENIYQGDQLLAPSSPHIPESDVGVYRDGSPSFAGLRKLRWLADHIMLPNEADHAVGCQHLYGILPDGQAFPTDNVSNPGFFDPETGREPSAVIVLPLKLAAHHLVQKAQEPLVQVSFKENPPPPPFHHYDAIGRACLFGLTYDETVEHEYYRQLDWLRHNRCDADVELTNEDVSRYRELLEKHSVGYRAHLATQTRGRS